MRRLLLFILSFLAGMIAAGYVIRCPYCGRAVVPVNHIGTADAWIRILSHVLTCPDTNQGMQRDMRTFVEQKTVPPTRPSVERAAVATMGGEEIDWRRLRKEADGERPGSSRPHCDGEVLHAPGECGPCDAYPDLQMGRVRGLINFTGRTDPTLQSDPASLKRTLADIERWPRNRPYPPDIQPRVGMKPPGTDIYQPFMHTPPMDFGMIQSRWPAIAVDLFGGGPIGETYRNTALVGHEGPTLVVQMSSGQMLLLSDQKRAEVREIAQKKLWLGVRFRFIDDKTVYQYPPVSP